MKNQNVFTNILSGIAHWCISPIGMITILIIIAAFGSAVLMVLKEKCKTNNLPFRVIRILFIAGYIGFALNFANVLIIQICTGIAKFFATKWIATAFTLTLTVVCYAIAIINSSRPHPTVIIALIRSVPFWIIGILTLPIGAYAIYRSGWLVLGSIFAEMFMIAGSHDLIKWLSEVFAEESYDIVESNNVAKQNRKNNFSNIIQTTGEAIRKITT